jgi:ring-1,2-phenylacetyl-CoA epoxidase subunit PaaB
MYGDPSPPSDELLGKGGDMPHYTREWHFDPYHQHLAFARSQAPEHVRADTEWSDWEVFQQDHRGEHHHHVGTVHAPDAEMALILAKESFCRRGEAVNLWVVEVSHIHATSYADADVFEYTTDKNYREPAGYHGLRKGKIHGRDRVVASEPTVEEGHP